MKSKSRVNILLVDDQPSKLLSYETILSGLGENLIKANSGKDALQLLLKNEFAVVLIDVCMPELDGFDLTSMIRSHPRFQKTAIILVSGVLMDDVDRLKGYVSGAVDYVSVPIVPEILRAKVSVFIDLYRKTLALERMNQELENRVMERTAEIEAAADLLRLNEQRMRLVLTAGGIQGWTWHLEKNELTWVTFSGRETQSFADFLALVHPEDRGLVQAAADRAVNNEEEYRSEFRTQNGEDRWWLGHGTVVRDSSGERAIAGINIDITARKQAEVERTSLLKAAEDARREAEKVNRLKDEFLATLSHELRTPLNAITGWAHMLQSEDLDEATQVKAIETIYRNALLQAQLIADLLDVSRIVSGNLRLDPQSVEFPSLIQAALDSLRPAAEERDIQIDSSGVHRVKCMPGDPARLQQVVWNLLSNAIKFTPRHGHVHVRLEDCGSQVELTVEDDGPGIPPDFLPYIFEPFRQADVSSARTHRGLGLGLAIVRNLVGLHGGRIQASNRHDRPGAVFKATLPTSDPALMRQNGGGKIQTFATENVSAEDSPAPLKDASVLVVDDELDAREVVAFILERCGAKVMVAASASAALRIVERERLSVIVADIEMPGEDGYSLLRKIRCLPSKRGGQTPTIALTANAGPQDQVRLLSFGFNRHVPKPVQPRELIAAVAGLLEPSEGSKQKRQRRVAPKQPARLDMRRGSV